jgi:hypothetical protein
MPPGTELARTIWFSRGRKKEMEKYDAPAPDSYGLAEKNRQRKRNFTPSMDSIY